MEVDTKENDYKQTVYGPHSPRQNCLFRFFVARNSHVQIDLLLNSYYFHFVFEHQRVLPIVICYYINQWKSLYIYYIIVIKFKWQLFSGM